MQRKQVSTVILVLAVLIGCHAGRGSADASGNQGKAQTRKRADRAKASRVEGEIEYTRELVMKKSKEVFPQEDRTMVMSLLDQYGGEPHEQERERVQLAILKLSDGDMEKLRERIKVAKEDFRDVLAYAEYPLQMKSVTRKVGAREAKEIREKDRKQYLDWLNGSPE